MEKCLIEFLIMLILIIKNKYSRESMTLATLQTYGELPDLCLLHFS